MVCNSEEKYCRYQGHLMCIASLHKGIQKTVNVKAKNKNKIIKATSSFHIFVQNMVMVVRIRLRGFYLLSRTVWTTWDRIRFAGKGFE